MDQQPLSKVLSLSFAGPEPVELVEDGGGSLPRLSLATVNICALCFSIHKLHKLHCLCFGTLSALFLLFFLYIKGKMIEERP